MRSGSRGTRQRRVALLIESSRAYGRELIRGIARFNKERARWRVEFTPRGLDDPPPAWLKAWSGEGILARVNDERMARALSAKRVPVVDLRRALRLKGVPMVGPDDAARLDPLLWRSGSLWQDGGWMMGRSARGDREVRATAPSLLDTAD